MRADLPPGLQMAQSVHAMAHFHHDHTDLVKPWLLASNFLVVVSVPDENALLDLIKEAKERGLTVTAVREPDIGDEVTAAAFEPGSRLRRLLAELPLALKPASDMRGRVRRAVTNHIGNSFGSGDEIADDIYYEVTNA